MWPSGGLLKGVSKTDSSSVLSLYVFTKSPKQEHFSDCKEKWPFTERGRVGGVERVKRHWPSKRHILTFHACHCAQAVRIVADSGACVLRAQRSTARFLTPLGRCDEMEEVRECGNEKHWEFNEASCFNRLIFRFDLCGKQIWNIEIIFQVHSLVAQTDIQNILAFHQKYNPTEFRTEELVVKWN